MDILDKFRLEKELHGPSVEDFFSQEDIFNSFLELVNSRIRKSTRQYFLRLLKTVKQYSKDYKTHFQMSVFGKVELNSFFFNISFKLDKHEFIFIMSNSDVIEYQDSISHLNRIMFISFNNETEDLRAKLISTITNNGNNIETRILVNDDKTSLGISSLSDEVYKEFAMFSSSTIHKLFLFKETLSTLLYYRYNE